MSLLVDQKYALLLSSKLDRFKRVDARVFNFRCPFCGDSQKNQHKARGYLYEKSGRVSFKCHNCSHSASLSGLIETVDPLLHREYKLEKFRESQSSNSYAVAIPSPSPVSIEKTRTDLMDLGLTPMSDLPTTHRAAQYLKGRMIPRSRWSDLYYCEDMRVFEKLNDAYRGRLMLGARIVIPYRNTRGELTGVSGRDLGTSKLRYVVVRLSEDAMIYGLDRVNVDRRVYVVEGQFDSMLVDNAIAAGGTDFQRAVDMLPLERAVLVFDNQPRNEQVVKLIERQAQRGSTCVVWPASWEYKDINEAVMDGVTLSEVMHVIDQNARSGLALKLAIRDWKKT